MIVLSVCKLIFGHNLQVYRTDTTRTQLLLVWEKPSISTQLPGNLESLCLNTAAVSTLNTQTHSCKEMAEFRFENAQIKSIPCCKPRGEKSKLSLSSESVETKLCKPHTSFTSHLHSLFGMVRYRTLSVNWEPLYLYTAAYELLALPGGSREDRTAVTGTSSQQETLVGSFTTVYGDTDTGKNTDGGMRHVFTLISPCIVRRYRPLFLYTDGISWNTGNTSVLLWCTEAGEGIGYCSTA